MSQIGNGNQESFLPEDVEELLKEAQGKINTLGVQIDLLEAKHKQKKDELEGLSLQVIEAEKKLADTLSKIQVEEKALSEKIQTIKEKESALTVYANALLEKEKKINRYLQIFENMKGVITRE